MVLLFMSRPEKLEIIKKLFFLNLVTYYKTMSYKGKINLTRPKKYVILNQKELI
jgi:hypothetical protein